MNLKHRTLSSLQTIRTSPVIQSDKFVSKIERLYLYALRRWNSVIQTLICLQILKKIVFVIQEQKHYGANYDNKLLIFYFFFCISKKFLISFFTLHIGFYIDFFFQ